MASQSQVELRGSLLATMPALLGQENSLDVGKDTTLGDGHGC